MKFALPRWRRTVIALAAGTAALGLGLGLSAASASAAGTARPVLVNCQGHGQTTPRSYILTCADDGMYLAGLHWASWSGAPGSGAAAFARGTDHENDCLPSCAQGHFHAYPALITVWRAEPWPGHHGQRYFSRVTAIFTGKRPLRYGPHGRKYRPQTFTWELGPLAG
jgi:hypothetical protein